ncbi:hypothetical protein VPH35_117358 [Triticum aestivum]
MRTRIPCKKESAVLLPPHARAHTHMPLLHPSLPPHRLLVVRQCRLIAPPVHPLSRLSVRAASVAHEVCALPFPPDRASHHRELTAAVASVERACRLCVDVRASMLVGDEKILEKNDQTHVTIADFGVQALISFELHQLFPSIPLVAEEDSAFIRSSNAADTIDRGGKDAVSFDSNPATYWLLDPIDGTKGFLKGEDSLYVVGLALVVDGKLAVGVMGCPNLTDTTVGDTEDESIAACPGHGILMVSHVGCGTWTRPMSADQLTTAPDIWKRCSVDPCSVAHMARFCIVDSHTWDMMPLSAHFSSTMDESEPRDENKILLQNSCGGSLSKYLLVACGRMSVFILLARAEKLLKAWDHAVGVICVEEAGGQTCDWSGKPLDFGADLTGRRIIYPSGGVLATNGALHDKLVEMVSANYK